MTTPAVIECKGLARWYGRASGLTDLSISIPPGITGLLGPNGAGKSTLLRLVSGLLGPSDGEVRVLGCDPVREPAVFRRLGFVSEDDALYEDMTPREMVGFLARISGMEKGAARSAAGTVLERVGLSGAMDRVTRGFSKGMRQKVRIAAALVHDPELLLLDEPMTGLDPVARHEMVRLICDLASRGKSVIFSSHILHEVESVAQHVVLLHRGMLLAHGSIDHIRECLADYAFTIEVKSPRSRDLAASVSGLSHVTRLDLGPGFVRIGTASSKALLSELAPLILDLGIEVEEITCPGDNLEALFEKLIR